jgi:hypothetical protein
LISVEALDDAGREALELTLEDAGPETAPDDLEADREAEPLAIDEEPDLEADELTLALDADVKTEALELANGEADELTTEEDPDLDSDRLPLNAEEAADVEKEEVVLDPETDLGTEELEPAGCEVGELAEDEEPETEADLKAEEFVPAESDEALAEFGTMIGLPAPFDV